MKKIILYLFVAIFTFIVLIFMSSIDKGIVIKPITQIKVVLDAEKIGLEDLVLKYPKLRVVNSEESIIEAPEGEIYDFRRLIEKTEGVLSVSLVPASFHFSFYNYNSVILDTFSQYTQGNIGEIFNIYTQKKVPLEEYLLTMVIRTFHYLVPALIFSIIIGIFLAVIASLNKVVGWFFDCIHKVMLCIPDYILIVILQFVAIYITKLTSTRVVLLYQLNNEIPFLVPFITISLIPSLLIYGTMRLAIERELTKQYIYTAYSKGISKFRIIRKHILPNTAEDIIAILPKTTYLAVGSTVMVEIFCQIMGLGGYYFFRGFQAINTMPITCLIFTCFIWSCNVLYSFINKKYIIQRKVSGD